MTQISRAAIFKEIEDGSQAIDDPDTSLGSLPVRLRDKLGGTVYGRRYTVAIVDTGESRTKHQIIEDSMQKSRYTKAYNTLEASQRSNDERLGAMSLTASGNLHQQQDEAVLSGWLHKTNRPKWTNRMTREPHEPRQRRRFKLTEHSLEHSHLLQRVCQTGSACS